MTRVPTAILDGVALLNLHLQPVMTMQQSKQAPYQPLSVTASILGAGYRC
jgi:hypothetical protein